ncbi:MAG: hypothetical protein D6704_08395 [Nitrospirae bacterium]|nr:MAG: hypothetical protein D6704_08395 [Nitrospirota bacterium]
MLNGLGVSTATESFSLIDLPWGASLRQFRQLNIPIEQEWHIWGRAQAIRIHYAPSFLPPTGSMILIFDRDFGLTKINWAGRPLGNDPTGTRGIALFERIATLLTSRYGDPDETSYLSSRLQGYHGDFYQCLMDSLCGEWRAIWRRSNGETLILELIGLDRETGFVHLAQQGPHLQLLLDQLHTPHLRL